MGVWEYITCTHVCMCKCICTRVCVCAQMSVYTHAFTSQVDGLVNKKWRPVLISSVSDDLLQGYFPADIAARILRTRLHRACGVCVCVGGAV